MTRYVALSCVGECAALVLLPVRGALHQEHLRLLPPERKLFCSGQLPVSYHWNSMIATGWSAKTSFTPDAIIRTVLSSTSGSLLSVFCSLSSINSSQRFCRVKTLHLSNESSLSEAEQTSNPSRSQSASLCPPHRLRMRWTPTLVVLNVPRGTMGIVPKARAVRCFILSR